MKMILLLLLPSLAHASYFRPIDPSHPQLNAGAYVDVETPGNTAFGTAVALVTHAVRDGCALPTLICEDWTPLAAGFSVNGGRFLIGVGPSFNLAPVVKSAILASVDAFTADNSYQGLKSSLGSVPISGPDVTMSFGPSWVLSPTENWKGYFRIFAGGMWRF